MGEAKRLAALGNALADYDYDYDRDRDVAVRQLATGTHQRVQQLLTENTGIGDYHLMEQHLRNLIQVA